MRQEEKLTDHSSLNIGTKAIVGDVFQVPISEECVGFGQILAIYKEEMLLMAIFDMRAGYDEVPSIESIISARPIFICNSLDAKIWHGQWKIIGNHPPDSAKILLPNYKVKVGDGFYVENYAADKTRLCKNEELASLEFRSCVAPIRLENALKAHWGFVPWNDAYNALLAENALKSTLVVVDQ